jgi:hypothetical protein
MAGSDGWTTSVLDLKRRHPRGGHDVNFVADLPACGSAVTGN